MINHDAYDAAERQRHREHELAARAAHSRFLIREGAPVAKIERINLIFAEADRARRECQHEARA